MQSLPRTSIRLALTVVLGAAPSAARAGVADSPVPELLPGQKTHHVYSVPGVTQSLGVVTMFSCTSLEKTATMEVGVELFPNAGGSPANNAAATSLSLAPGATVNFSTGAVSGFSVDAAVVGAFVRGSARILATSRKLMCTAFLADAGSAPPSSMTHLTIISKTRQKAAN